MQPSLFDAPVAKAIARNEVDYHILPATEKQQRFARQIALRAKKAVPEDILGDRQRLSKWIDANKTRQVENKFDRYPSSKQVAFAERIARMKRRPVPPECFRDKTMMSRWIDSNR